MTLLEIIKEKLKLDLTNGLIVPWNNFMEESDFEIKPFDFLRYAKEDFQDNSNKALINCLSNCKRSIDCQIDSTLKICGINYKDIPLESNDIINSTNIDKSLAHKLKLISSLGFAPSVLISKIRQIRNSMEHEYYLPKRNEVHEGLELTELFISTISHKLNPIQDSFFLTSKSHHSYDIKDFRHKFNRGIKFDFDCRDSKQINIDIIENNIRQDNVISFSQNDIEYYHLLKVLVNAQNSFDFIEATKDFLQHIQHPIPRKNINLTVCDEI